MTESNRIQQQMSSNLRVQHFIVRDDQISTGKAWEEWLEEIEREFQYFNITDPLS